MPLFRYRAISTAGKKTRGVIDADSFAIAKEKLKQANVFVTRIAKQRSQKELTLSPALLLSVTRELCQLITAGLPLYESLVTIEEKYRKHKTHALFLDLCDRLKRGEHLSASLKAYPKTFDAIYISLVETGENTGSLAWAFEQLYELIERKQKLKKKLVSAMAYPAFLGVFCLCMVMGLLLFVVPSMSELFEGRTLHPLTQGVLAMSHFFKAGFVPLLLALLAVSSLLVYLCRRASFRKTLFQWVLKIPLVRTILQQAALIRFSRSCSILLAGSVPLPTALAISRGVMKHPAMEEVISQAEKQIIEGETLSGIFRASPQMPPLVGRMLSIAEETGQMPKMLKSLSDIYDQELERNLTYVTTFLQPVLLILLGGVIGLVILSILLPLTDVSSLIST